MYLSVEPRLTRGYCKYQMAGSLLGWLWPLPCTDAAVLMLRLGRRLCCECEPHGCAAAPLLLNECDGACCWLWLWPCVECPGCACHIVVQVAHHRVCTSPLT